MWEAVIGLEVHVQLATRSKIFSGSATTFGAQPNTQASLVDLGLPGVLPVLNAEAVRMACLFGLAIDAEMAPTSIFARKNYFYPDSPKGYQISQYEQPIVGKGQLQITLDQSTKSIAITRAHLEEDAGKSIHDRLPHATAIDLNRAGMPLLEIVSEPVLTSSAEAVAYLKALHTLVTYLGISDGNMAEGSMRCDANVSIRPRGQTKLGTRTEIKNINSFRFVEKAIDYEIARQIDVLEQGGRIEQETRLFDSVSQTTRTMRSKEHANDYRYFPDPDLLPVAIDPQWLQQLATQLPELPAVKCARFQQQHQLSAQDALQLCQQKALADYFENTVQHAQQLNANAPAKLCANWLLSEVLGQLNKNQHDIHHCPITPQQLAQLVVRIHDQTLSSKMAKQVFETLWLHPQDVDHIIEQQGLKQVSDHSALQQIIQDVIQQNPEQVQQYQQSTEDKRKKLLGFFVGQIMKQSKGQANPQVVNELLMQALQ
jgi:aspartyl-tRNA(Asn)/glutamyl-tRNA(Gln) amidotransferase subunit B